MNTLHDVVRFLVRTSRFPDELAQQAALLSVDAHEKGFPNREAYEKDLAQKAALAAREANPDGPETPEQTIARLEAENTRLQALAAAQTPKPPPV